MAQVGNVAADQLRSIVERIERLEEEKKNIASDVRDVFAEAKANGYDTKMLRQIIRLRKLDNHERDEEEYTLDLYKRALGMAPEVDESEPPLPLPPGDNKDPLYADAVRQVRESGKASPSSLQRSLKIGFARAAALIERMEGEGIVTEPDEAGRRQVVPEGEE